VSANEVRQLLADPSVDRNRRLLRLQGQRGVQVEQAVAAGWAIRLGPAQCAFFSAVAVALHEPRLFLALGMASAVGVVTAHHPVEWLYVWWAGRHRRPTPPANRAPRRFACLLGAVCFLVAAGSLASGAGWIYWPTVLTLVGLPTFVAATNLCVPSLLFTLVLGTERATCASLPASLKRERQSLHPQRS
jgi:Domain of unknown function (DUF4395)